MEGTPMIAGMLGQLHADSFLRYTVRTYGTPQVLLNSNRRYTHTLSLFQGAT